MTKKNDLKLLRFFGWSVALLAYHFVAGYLAYLDNSLTPPNPQNPPPASK